MNTTHFTNRLIVLFVAVAALCLITYAGEATVSNLSPQQMNNLAEPVKLVVNQRESITDFIAGLLAGILATSTVIYVRSHRE